MMDSDQNLVMTERDIIWSVVIGIAIGVVIFTVFL